MSCTQLYLLKVAEERGDVIRGVSCGLDVRYCCELRRAQGEAEEGGIKVLLEAASKMLVRFERVRELGEEGGVRGFDLEARLGGVDAREILCMGIKDDQELARHKGRHVCRGGALYQCVICCTLCLLVCREGGCVNSWLWWRWGE